MSDIRKLVPNVHEFLEKASMDIGRIEAESFSQDLFCQLVEGEMSSPIEHLFFVAMHVMARAHRWPVNAGPEFDASGQTVLAPGLYVTSQVAIDQYRVDFLVSVVGYTRARETRSVVVELDGHDFHDKDKRQRSYEKARDRHLQRKGYHVLHFTGSDVVRDPYRVAHEVMGFLLCFGGLGAEPYDPENPLGI